MYSISFIWCGQHSSFPNPLLNEISVSCGHHVRFARICQTEQGGCKSCHLTSMGVLFILQFNDYHVSVHGHPFQKENQGRLTVSVGYFLSVYFPGLGELNVKIKRESSRFIESSEN